MFNQIDPRIIAGAGGFLFAWLFILTFLLVKAVSHYRRLVGKTKKKDLKNILDKILAKIEKQDKKSGKLEERCDQLEKLGLKHLQKVGFLRFNPFSDTGGDQSFVLSFLDGKDNGIILSSLHSRGTTRIYAKAVKKGKGDKIELSKEEKEVIKKAKK